VIGGIVWLEPLNRSGGTPKVCFPIFKWGFVVLVGFLVGQSLGWGEKMGLTREELQIILLDMEAYISRTNILAESESHKALRQKIESMIDNYCEHPEHYTFEYGAFKIYFCNQCKYTWRDK